MRRASLISLANFSTTRIRIQKPHLKAVKWLENVLSVHSDYKVPDYFEFKKYYKSGQEFVCLKDDNAVEFVKRAKVVSLPKSVLRTLHHTKDPHSRLSIILSLSEVYRIHPLVYLFHYNQLCRNISTDSLEKLLLALCSNLWYENAAFILSSSNLSISEILNLVSVVVEYIIDHLKDGPLGAPEFLRFFFKLYPNAAFQRQVIKQLLPHLKKVLSVDFIDPCSAVLQKLTSPEEGDSSLTVPGSLARKIHSLEREQAYEKIAAVVEKADVALTNVLDLHAILSYSSVSSAYALWCKWKKFDTVFIEFFIRHKALGFADSCFAECCNSLDPQTIAGVLNENLFEKRKNSSLAPSQPLLTLQRNLCLLEERKLSEACEPWSVLIRNTDSSIGLEKMDLLLKALAASSIRTIPEPFLKSLCSKVMAGLTEMKSVRNENFIIWLEDFLSLEKLHLENKIAFTLRLLKIANRDQTYHAMTMVLKKLPDLPLQKVPHFTPLISEAFSRLDHSQRRELIRGFSCCLNQESRPCLHLVIKQVFKDKIKDKMDTKNPLKISDEFNSVYQLLEYIDSEGFSSLTGPSKRYLVKSLSFYNPHLGKAFVEQFRNHAISLEILEGFLMGIMKSQKTNISPRGKLRIFERTLRNNFHKQNLNMRSPIIELIEFLLRTANESGTLPKQRLQWALHLARSNNVDLQKYPRWAEVLKEMVQTRA